MSAPVKSSLPRAASVLVGRHADLAELDQLMRHHRLVTVLGPPGAGKTRLALEYAHQHAAAFVGDGAGGAWFVDLSECSSDADVCEAVARSLNVELTGRDDSVTQLGRALAVRGPTLLLLDNFEHLPETSSTLVGRWVESAPELSVLVTSRARLDLAGETCMVIGGLSIQAEGATSDAVELFVARARAVRTGFSPTPDESKAISKLVTLLDGLPLAIELAGARMAVLSPAQLLDRLSERLDALGGSRGATLRAAVEWSWNLLDRAEQSALAQLSVFHGGLSVEAAEAVIDLNEFPNAPMVLDVIESLRNKSLLTARPCDELGGEIRFGMLDTIRRYVSDRLTAPARAAVEERHASYFLKVGHDLAALVESGPAALTRLAVEKSNLLAVHRRALDAKPARRDRALSALLALDHLFYMRGPTEQALELLEETLRRDVSGVEPRTAALGLKAHARALLDAGRPGESRALLQRGLALAHDLGDASLTSRLLGHLAFAAASEGKFPEALEHLLLARGHAQAAGDRRVDAMLLTTIAETQMELGQFDEASAVFHEALTLNEAAGNRYAAAACLASRAELNRRRGRHAAALDDLRNALATYEEFGERRHEGSALLDLGVLHQEQGRFAEAQDCFERALRHAREFGSPRLEGLAAARLGGLQREQGEFAAARRSLQDATRLLEAAGDDKQRAMALARWAGTLAQGGQPVDAAEMLQRAVALAGSDATVASVIAAEREHLVEEAESKGARSPPREWSTSDSHDLSNVGRYDLLLKIEAGGMATVYVGRQRGAAGFERVVALKKLHSHLGSQSDFVSAFMDEARFASMIRHPNVVGVHDVEEVDGERLLVMEYVDGSSLAQLQQNAQRAQKPVPRPVALRILTEVLRGLDAAHELCDLDGQPLGIVHRDATPHNVLVGADGAVKLTDFGIAKASQQSHATEPGRIKGKFRYMAPEQLGSGPVDRRADVFAVAVMAWELLTGRRLFEGANDADVVLQIAAGDLPPPNSTGIAIPSDLEAYVMRGIAYEPGDRWPSAGAFADALEAWANEQGQRCEARDVARWVAATAGDEIAERRQKLSRALSRFRPLMEPDDAPPSTRRLGGPGPELVVDAEGRWFETPGEPRVDLGRRRALRRILKALLARRVKTPDVASTLDEILAAGWPGEQVQHGAGVLRVYNAVSTLRKLGLRAYLVSRDDGYLLDPRVPVRAYEEPTR